MSVMQNTIHSLGEFLKLNVKSLPQQQYVAQESVIGSYLQDMTETMCSITISKLYTIINCLQKIK